MVAHKGIGKSALFAMAIENQQDQKQLTILIRPDDIINIESSHNFNMQIKEWKEGILQIIEQKVYDYFNVYDYLDIPSDDNKEALGKKNRTISFLTNLVNTFKPLKDKINLDPIKREILQNFLRNNKIYIYIDDLDRGWKGRVEDIQKISTLLNAVRDLSSQNNGVYFRISLRSDVFFLYRTSDESTDKIEGSVVWYKWNLHQILALLVKRILTFDIKDQINEEILMQCHQDDLMNKISHVIDPRFHGRGKWEDIETRKVILALTRKRPRDLVKLLTLAARKSYQNRNEKIGTEDLMDIFDEYSQNRLLDTINEYRSELKDLERLLMNMRPVNKKRTTRESFTFSTDNLLTKIKNIETQGKFFWANGKQAQPKELLSFLYKINFLIARKNTDNGIERIYFEENQYISNQFKDFGYEWEIHPAYRWALRPNTLDDIFSSI